MPDRTPDAAASERDPLTPPPGLDPSTDAPSTDLPGEAPASEPADRAKPTAAGEPGGAPAETMPEYKGEPLDAERGPGLGCFWIQIALLTFFLVFTPLTVTWGWDPTISGILLILTLILLLFSGQTIIFLLRLVAADRRSRRTPLSSTAKPTVGQMEDAGSQPTTPDASAAVENADDPPGGNTNKGAG